jgi:serine/threonine-protein kinase
MYPYPNWKNGKRAFMTTLGKYELHEQLGKGGFGTVYRATDNIGRVVAIKVLKPSFTDDPEVLNRFKREALAAGSLFHPYIATILDFDEGDGRVYIVMRYIDGQPLDKILKERGKLLWEEAVKIIEQVAEALQFAHEKGFIHRDIKPGNIIISSTEGAVLTDFGLVKAVTASGLSTTGVMIGTPAYIAPEIWSGKSASPATDVYSLACVFYEMITGDVLFDGESTPEIMMKHFSEIQLPEKWPIGVPEKVKVIFTKALSKNPKDRFQSINEMIDALHGLETSLSRQITENDINLNENISKSRKTAFTSKNNGDDEEDHSEISRSNPVSDNYVRNYSKINSQSVSERRGKKWVVVSLIIVSIVLYVIGLGITKSSQIAEQGKQYSENTLTSKSVEAERTVTQSPNFTQTAIINSTATAISMNSEINALQSEGVLVFGPQNGSLAHVEDEFSEDNSSNLYLTDFITEATFTNPYDANEHNWDYGFLFRLTGSNQEYRLYITSLNYWELGLRNDDIFDIISTGVLKNANGNSGEKNSITLVVLKDKGYFLLNGEFISKLNLSKKIDPGEIRISTGMNGGDEINGKETKYENWRIWKFDNKNVSGTPTSPSTQCLINKAKISFGANILSGDHDQRISPIFVYDGEWPEDIYYLTTKLSGTNQWCAENSQSPGNCEVSDNNSSRLSCFFYGVWDGAQYPVTCSQLVTLSSEKCGFLYDYYYSKDYK